MGISPSIPHLSTGWVTKVTLRGVLTCACWCDSARACHEEDGWKSLLGAGAGRTVSSGGNAGFSKCKVSVQLRI